MYEKKILLCIEERITVHLLVQEIHSELKTDGFHIVFLKGACDVHVHLKKPFHRRAKLGLFDFQLGEQIHEPLEGMLISIYPEEIDLEENIEFKLTGTSVKYILNRFIESPSVPFSSS